MEMIVRQLQYFLAAFLYGVLLLFMYDFLRIARRLIPHSVPVVMLQDLIFWSAAAVFVFRMVFETNSGILRGFAAVSLAFGMYMYYLLAGNRFSSWVAGLLHKMLYPVFRGIKKVQKKAKNLLKKYMKTRIIAIRRNYSDRKHSCRKKGKKEGKGTGER